MLASRQAGMHGNQAGDPWKHSRAADKGSLVLSMRQTRCERWPCHTHRGELREAASGASRGGCPGPTPPAAASEEGAKTPPGSLSCLALSLRRARPRLFDALWHSQVVRLVGTEADGVELADAASTPLVHPLPAAGEITLLYISNWGPSQCRTTISGMYNLSQDKLYSIDREFNGWKA